MKLRILFCCILLLSVSSSILAQGDILAEVKNLYPHDVKVDGFVLDTDQDVSIKGLLAGNRRDDVYTSAWILNARTRTVAWKSRDAKRSRWSDGLVELADMVSLPGGTYEVYYSAFPSYYSGDFDGVGDFFGFLADKIFDRNGDRRLYKDLHITIRGSGRNLGSEGVDENLEQLRKEALISLTGLWDDDYVQQGFTLQKPTTLSLYALGEARDDGNYDHGWIVNVKTGERVWKMSYRNSDHAGGDRKNRMVKETLSLPAGSYAVFYATDGSHSFRDWNAPPPYDPPFWGITLATEDPSMKGSVALFDYKGVEEKNVIVNLTKMRDDEYASKGFTLNKPMEVRIIAFGEGSSGRMHDYGWIVDLNTRKKVWVMEYDDTEHGGGAEKNRMVEKTLRLEKGSYMVYYVTDGSHSYRDWNSSPPYDQERWGITLAATGDSFKASDVAAYEEKNDPSVLASLTGIRDDERRRQSFTLGKKSDVHVYALGEGSDGSMHDYAWIEDASTRKVVWEMTYRTTDHAGGARKNRSFDGTITLPAGSYTLYYESDDSHSFNDWNDDPPFDQSGWGVTLTLAEGRQP
ncbi:MAG: hypothetical protein WEE20_00945 [Bacteroidota bacterium]